MSYEKNASFIESKTVMMNSLQVLSIGSLMLLLPAFKQQLLKFIFFYKRQSNQNKWIVTVMICDKEN